jgi:hypothetical protein
VTAGAGRDVSKLEKNDIIDGSNPGRTGSPDGPRIMLHAAVREML